jgi:hypothetical protein
VEITDINQLKIGDKVKICDTGFAIGSIHVGEGEIVLSIKCKEFKEK